MLTSLFTLVYWAGVIQNFAIVVSIISGGSVLILGVIWLMNVYSYPDLTENQIKAVKKWTITSSIIFVIFLLIAILIPDKTSILTFAALHELDKYNSTHVSSSLTPDAAYSTLDGTVKNISSILNGVADKVKVLTK